MSEVLYRKYRPQTFAEVLGQEVVKTIIQNALKSGRVSHAYLFTGPRGVGKTTVARLLAKSLNCLHFKNGEPDGTCENCVALQEGRFLDLLEIDAASYTGVDNIRDIINHVKFAPNHGRYKVFIIDEVHMLSKAAFNALLKTLEEPPAHAVFILATTEIHKVPATIISRSQRFDFKRVSSADIILLLNKILEENKVKITAEGLQLVATAADGSFRDALSILDQLLSLGAKTLGVEEIEEVLGITRLGTSQRFLELVASGEQKTATAFVKDLSFQGKDLVQFTRDFLEYLRLVLFVKMDAERIPDLGLGAEEADRLGAQARGIPGARLLEIIRRFLEAFRELRTTPVPELPLLAEILALGGTDGAAVGKKTAAEAAPARTGEPQTAKPGQAENSGGAASPAALLDLGGILDRWAEVLGRIKDYNHSLLSSLRLGRVVKLEGEELVLAFPYNFHKETIEARKNRIVVEQVLEDVFARPLRIRVYLERELQQQDEAGKPGTDLMSEALKVLGET